MVVKFDHRFLMTGHVPLFVTVTCTPLDQRIYNPLVRPVRTPVKIGVSACAMPLFLALFPNNAQVNSKNTLSVTGHYMHCYAVIACPSLPVHSDDSPPGSASVRPMPFENPPSRTPIQRPSTLCPGSYSHSGCPEYSRPASPPFPGAA